MKLKRIKVTESVLKQNFEKRTNNYDRTITIINNIIEQHVLAGEKIVTIIFDNYPSGENFIPINHRKKLIQSLTKMYGKDSVYPSFSGEIIINFQLFLI
jgi:hypothetical protein